MDYAIIEFIKGYPEGVTSEVVWKAITSPKMNLAKTEDALDDLVKDDLIVLSFIDSKTVYAIA